MPKLVFARHGESEWNLANLFTGWADVDLSENGTKQAIEAGKLIKEAGIEFDIAYTSVLKRAIKTTNLALEYSDQLWVPVVKSWRLNERHYGGLTGLNKADAAAKHGDEQVHIWRRSYDVLPPAMDHDDKYTAHGDRRYAGLEDSLIPDAENLKVTLERALPFWEDQIAPALKEGKMSSLVLTVTQSVHSLNKSKNFLMTKLWMLKSLTSHHLFSNLMTT